MKLTNKFNLPETIVRATIKVKDQYDSRADRSVTQLIGPPRIDRLYRKHWQDVSSDVSDEFFSILGSAVHYILEMGAGHDEILEERLFANVSGWTVSGQIDVQKFTRNGVSLKDYKLTSSYKLQKNDLLEWEKQLNVYAFLVYLNKGIHVTDISVVAIIRDFTAVKAQTDATYPQSPIMVIPLNLWTIEEQRNFVLARVALHQDAAIAMDCGEELPDCTDDDIWLAGSEWAVKKTGGKRATRTFDNEEEARQFANEKGEGYQIDFRPGTPRRCEGNYCGVAEWCSQYARWKAAHGPAASPGSSEGETQERQDESIAEPAPDEGDTPEDKERGAYTPDGQTVEEETRLAAGEGNTSPSG